MLEKHFGCVRWIYNWALAERIKAYQTEKKSISRFELQARIPAMKAAEETAWLAEVNAQSLQSALRNLDMAYACFFRKHNGFPRFKCKSSAQSFQAPQRGSIDFEKRTLSVPKIFDIKFRDPRRFDGIIKTVTLFRTPTGKYYAGVCVEIDGEELTPRTEIKDSEVVGIDLGINHFATLSTGVKIENPRPLKKALRELRRVNRAFSRKKMGSNNRNKSRLRLATVYEKVANRRRDFQHKLSTQLIRENQAVALETLTVENMLLNRRSGQAIVDAGWGLFVKMLEYKAKRCGKTVLRIGKFTPSSKLCSCGVINQELKWGDTTWKCKSCGTTHDRDILAANNIKRMALNPSNFLGQGMTKFKPVETGLAGR